MSPAVVDVLDVLILGAGGAGLMCAAEAGRRGRSVTVLDHARKPGGKILISGGGRCNFTNLGTGPGNYVSSNPHFCKSALSRFPATSFIERVSRRGIPFHEKKLGQLFCDRSAQDILDLLLADCADAGARLELGCAVRGVERAGAGDGHDDGARFVIDTDRGPIACRSLVVATGGLSIPKLGATGVGYEIARRFGLRVTETAPALDGFTLDGPEFQGLAGTSVDCVLTTENGASFRESLLFTHAGLSGPVALQASLHWRPGEAVTIDFLPDLLPDEGAFAFFISKKREGSRSVAKNLLSELLPARLAERLCEGRFDPATPLPQLSEKALERFCAELHAWKIRPSGTVGYSKAEVTRGGVDTDELSSKTMEARKVPGLHFIGEVVDVTGWLGGYNFQWAWASGWAAGQVV